MDKADLEQLVLEYITESESSLDEVNNDLFEIENGSTESTLIQAFKGKIHSLKGSCYLVGLQKMGDLLHQLEDDLKALDSGDIPEKDRLMDFSYRVMDAFRAVLNNTQKAGVFVDLEDDSFSESEVVPAPSDNSEDVEKLDYSECDMELVAGYLEESEDRLDRAFEILHEIDQGDRSAEQLEILKRDVHSLKGAAYMVGLIVSGTIFHRFEDILAKIESGELNWSDSLIDLCFRVIDVIRDIVQKIKTSNKPMEYKPEGIYEELESYLSGNHPVPAAAQESDSVTQILEGLVSVFKPIDESYQKILDGDLSNEKYHALLSGFNQYSEKLKSVDLPKYKAFLAALGQYLLFLRQDIVSWKDSDLTLLGKSVERIAAFHTEVEQQKELVDPDISDIEKKLLEKVRTKYSDPTKNESKTVAVQNVIAKKNVIQTLRVDIKKIDKNMNLVTELVINRIRFDERLRKLLALLDNVEKNIRTLSEISTKEENKIDFDILEQKVASRFFKIGIADQVKDPVKVLENDVKFLFSEYKRSISHDKEQSLFSEIRSISDELKDIMAQSEENSIDLINTTDMIGVVTTDLQENLMKIRMLPVSTLFTKFKRLAREIAKETDKKIEFTVYGEETELDKNVIEEIADPLMHIIRNSIDHGIEYPKERKEKGKKEVGRVSLTAYYEGNQVVIEVTDDGKGLNVEQLKISAIKKSLYTPEQLENMSDEEIQSIIFMPGFSTASKVTKLSGRGVGMDVVKTNISKLKGIVNLRSEFGKGTIFKIRLPLTLAVLQSLLIKCGEEIYAVPLSFVDKTITLSPEALRKIGNSRVINLMGKTIPIQSLSTLIGVPSSKRDKAEKQIAILTRFGKQLYALLIDDLVGRQEIVIKTLGDYLKNVPDVTGATILGDGSVVLILDVLSILTKAHSYERSISQAVKKYASVEAPTEEMDTELTIKSETTQKGPLIMVVDDSALGRKTIVRALQLSGYETIEAIDGEEAFLLATIITVDLFTVDIEMPRLNGYELVKKLRALDQYKTTPIAMVTARSDKMDKQKGLQVGADDYFTKPFNTSDLIKFVMKKL